MKWLLDKTSNHSGYVWEIDTRNQTLRDSCSIAPNWISETTVLFGYAHPHTGTVMCPEKEHWKGYLKDGCAIRAANIVKSSLCKLQMAVETRRHP